MPLVLGEAQRDSQNRELPPGAALFSIVLNILFGANAVAIKISLTGLGIFTTAGLRFSSQPVPSRYGLF